MKLPIGTPVKHSGYVIRPKRDYWLAQGEYAAKTRAKTALDETLAERGVITAHVAGDDRRGVSPGYVIRWNSGATSSCLPHMIEEA